MAIAIARVCPLHLMNADWVPGGCYPSDQAVNLPVSCCRQNLPSPFTVISSSVSLKADIHFALTQKVGSRVGLGTAVRMCRPF